MLATNELRHEFENREQQRDMLLYPFIDFQALKKITKRCAIHDLDGV